MIYKYLKILHENKLLVACLTNYVSADFCADNNMNKDANRLWKMLVLRWMSAPSVTNVNMRVGYE